MLCFKIQQIASWHISVLKFFLPRSMHSHPFRKLSILHFALKMLRGSYKIESILQEHYPKYWTESNDALLCGNLLVTLESEQKADDFVTRNFKIKKTDVSK